jgi:hypothetical protein
VARFLGERDLGFGAAFEISEIVCRHAYYQDY